MARDIHSFAEPLRIRVAHCSLRLEVDFERRRLQGSALLELDRTDPEAPLIVDTRDLSIEDVLSGGEALDYSLGGRDPVLGSPLAIHLPPHAASVLIRYSTGPEASGLQWLNANQTAGGELPFLFTQSQSIHARSWIPIQDSPGVRMTYDAAVRTAPGFMAIMSAQREDRAGDWQVFRMNHPIPAYLFALAVGRLEYRPLGPRTGVYAEPLLLEAAAKEFEDIEKLVQTVEGLYGPYRWGRYELLILPRSFPYGGMENPIVTFATSTILAGDKSLIGLVSHELAHSWSGNLVTNATWSDFWLNEGFTTYIENRIQEAVYGREQALMEQVLDRRELNDELRDFGAKDQILHIDLAGRHPDEGCTRVPYVKGALLLRCLEQVFGRDVFDDCLRAYFEHFAFQSITTEEALSYLKLKLFSADPAKAAGIPLDEWVFAPGLPESAPPAVSRLLEEVTLGTQHATAWNTQQWLEFLQTLPRPVTSSVMEELDTEFHLTESANYEILQEWLQLVIESRYDAAYERLDNFLCTVGRIRYLRPLYRELAKTQEGRNHAQQIFAKAKSFYHPMARTAVERVLFLEEKASGEQGIDARRVKASHGVTRSADQRIAK